MNDGQNAALAWNEENPEDTIDMDTMVPLPTTGASLGFTFTIYNFSFDEKRELFSLLDGRPCVLSFAAVFSAAKLFAVTE